MKIGIVLTTIGIMSLVTLVAFLVMNLLMGNYISVIWMTIYTGIISGITLSSGIKRIRKAKQ